MTCSHVKQKLWSFQIFIQKDGLVLYLKEWISLISFNWQWFIKQEGVRSRFHVGQEIICILAKFYLATICVPIKAAFTIQKLLF